LRTRCEQSVQLGGVEFCAFQPPFLSQQVFFAPQSSYTNAAHALSAWHLPSHTVALSPGASGVSLRSPPKRFQPSLQVEVGAPDASSIDQAVSAVLAARTVPNDGEAPKPLCGVPDVATELGIQQWAGVTSFFAEDR